MNRLAEPNRPTGLSWLGLAGWLTLCFGAAGLGTMFRPGEWYKNLAKPWWTPPDWLFGPVWTLLYLFMGVAAWLVWRRGGFQEARGALALFLVQLLLNALWSWVFFGLQQPGWAFLELSLLWLAIAATLAAFWRLVPAAGWLLAPYLAWVSFAGVLNFALWHLNC